MGDLDFNNHVDNNDIDGNPDVHGTMTWALTDLTGYASYWGLTPQEEKWVLDVNQDGVINNGDLEALTSFASSDGY